MESYARLCQPPKTERRENEREREREVEVYGRVLQAVLQAKVDLSVQSNTVELSTSCVYQMIISSSHLRREIYSIILTFALSSRRLSRLNPGKSRELGRYSL